MAVAVNWASMTLRSSRRTLNQDRLGVDGTTFCVADGMGGPGGGHRAATAAIRAAMTTHPTDQATMRETILAANQAVLTASAARGQKIGTTLTIVTTTPHGLVIGSVGDTRAYTQPWTQATARQLTVDDTLAKVDNVNPGDPRYPTATATLTRHLGSEELVAATIRTLELPITETTTITITTDGIHEAVTHDDLYHNTALSPDEHALYLLSQASQHGTADDATALIIIIEP